MKNVSFLLWIWVLGGKNLILHIFFQEKARGKLEFQHEKPINLGEPLQVLPSLFCISLWTTNYRTPWVFTFDFFVLQSIIRQQKRLFWSSTHTHAGPLSSWRVFPSPGNNTVGCRRTLNSNRSSSLYALAVILLTFPRPRRCLRVFFFFSTRMWSAVCWVSEKIHLWVLVDVAAAS